MASSSSKSDHQEKQTRASLKHTRYAAYVVVGIIVVMSAAMGTIWAVVKPKRPVYAIEFGFVKNAKGTYTDLDANLSFVMRSYNPNKKSTIFYKTISISNSYGDSKVEVWSTEDVSQPPFNVTRMRFIVPVKISTAIGDDVRDYLRQHKITTNISVKAVMRYEISVFNKVWKCMPRSIGISCLPATVMRNQNFKTTPCLVNL